MLVHAFICVYIRVFVYFGSAYSSAPMDDMSPLHRKVFVYDNTPLCKVGFENIMNF